jgi:hypothetical protein
MIKKLGGNNKNKKFKNIAPNKAGLTHKIHDLDIRYIQITCLSCVLGHEIEII